MAHPVYQSLRCVFSNKITGEKVDPIAGSNHLSVQYFVPVVGTF